MPFIQNHGDFLVLEPDTWKVTAQKMLEHVTMASQLTNVNKVCFVAAYIRSRELYYSSANT